MSFLKDLKATYSVTVRYVHCDNAGENEALCKQKEMGVNFEYTMPGTVQQNGQVERKFTSLFTLVHAMLNSRKFSPFLRNGLCADAANTAMLLKNKLS